MIHVNNKTVFRFFSRKYSNGLYCIKIIVKVLLLYYTFFLNIETCTFILFAAIFLMFWMKAFGCIEMTKQSLCLFIQYYCLKFSK